MAGKKSKLLRPNSRAVIKPSDGGTLEVLDFRPSAVTLINSLQRRVEAYHSQLQNAAQFAAKVASIHEQTLAKEPGLEKRLKYDRWARNAFRLLLFAPGKTHADFEALHLEESAAFAGGDYRVEQATAEEVKLCMEAPLRQVIAGADPDCILCAAKVLQFEDYENGFDVRCRIDLALMESASPALARQLPRIIHGGIGDCDQSSGAQCAGPLFRICGRAGNLWSGAAWSRGPACVSRMNGKMWPWRSKRAGASQLWISPIETVSESEEGFERVYQGSQILGVWDVALGPAEPWSAETVLHVSAARST